MVAPPSCGHYTAIRPRFQHSRPGDPPMTQHASRTLTLVGWVKEPRRRRPTITSAVIGWACVAFSSLTHHTQGSFAAIISVVVALISLRAEPPSLKSPALKSPQEEKATFQLHPGFKIELVACEPQIVDPVAMAFDQDGRLYVAEMRGYPNGGFGTGNITSGSIKLLEDRDGDGFYETAT